MVIIIVAAPGSDVTPLLNQVLAAVNSNQATLDRAFLALQKNNDRAETLINPAA